MKKYIIIYRMNDAARAAMSEYTKEGQMEEMKAWYAWKDKMGDSLIDFGAPLMSGRRILPDGSAENGSVDVSGYSIIQANDFDSAKSLLVDHPHLGWNGGCDIELHEIVQM